MKAISLFLFLLALTAFAEAPAKAGAFSGKVLEAIDASSYTYLRLATDSGEVWVAVNQGTFKVGQSVEIEPSTTMKNFESKQLHRKFDSIVFGSSAARRWFKNGWFNTADARRNQAGDNRNDSQVIYICSANWIAAFIRHPTA